MTKPFNSPSDFNGIRDEIVRLRCLGYGQLTIAKMLSLSENRVREILKSEFIDRFADRDELKRQTAMELDWLLRPLKLKYEKNPNRQDAETILKIIERKCRLFALDEAVKLEVKHIEELSEDEIKAELARYGIVQKSPPELPEATKNKAVDWIDAEIVEKEKVKRE